MTSAEVVELVGAIEQILVDVHACLDGVDEGEEVDHVECVDDLQDMVDFVTSCLKGEEK